MAGLKEQTLTREQMARLKELGVDTTKASVVLIYKDDNGNEVEWDEVIEADGGNFFCKDETFDEEYDLSEEFLDAETGYYDHSFRLDCGVFTLEDILKVLPKSVENDHNIFYLCLNYQKEEVAYYNYDEDGLHFLIGADADADVSMLFAAYDLLCWCAENGKLKTE